VILLMAAVAVYVFMLVVIARATVRGLRAGVADAAVRWGELLGPAEMGANQHSEGSLASEGSLGRMDRHRFRQLAARREARP